MSTESPGVDPRCRVTSVVVVGAGDLIIGGFPELPVTWYGSPLPGRGDTVRLSWVRALLSETSETDATDLATQFEAILDAVWKAEADWGLNDRIDLAVGLDRDRR